MSDLPAIAFWSMYKPKVVAKWFTNAFAGSGATGVLIHGHGCHSSGPCMGYCRCWCHGPIGEAVRQVQEPTR